MKAARHGSFFFKSPLRALFFPLILLILYLCFYGIPFLGLPGEREISYITLEAADGRRREIREPEDIALLVQSAGLLNTRLTGRGEGQPCLTLTFYLKDGGQIQLKAGLYAVWYKGRVRPLKQEEVFVHVAEGLFLPDAPPDRGEGSKEDTE